MTCELPARVAISLTTNRTNPTISPTSTALPGSPRRRSVRAEREGENTTCNHQRRRERAIEAGERDGPQSRVADVALCRRDNSPKVRSRASELCRSRSPQVMRAWRSRRVSEPLEVGCIGAVDHRIGEESICRRHRWPKVGDDAFAAPGGVVLKIVTPCRCGASADVCCAMRRCRKLTVRDLLHPERPPHLRACRCRSRDPSGWSSSRPGSNVIAIRSSARPAAR